MKNITHPPVLYLFIYKVIKEKSCGRPFITYACVKEIFKRRFYKIPKYIHYLVLGELEEMGLLKKIGHTNNLKYKLVGKDIDKLINQYNPLF